VLQHRQNHDTSQLLSVSVDERPDLATRFRVAEVPTLLVIENQKVVLRIIRTRGSRDLERNGMAERVRGCVDPCHPAHFGREGVPCAVHVQASRSPVPDEARVGASLIPPAMH
jgi:hypothetical protein